MRHKRGDIRGDGRIFWAYAKDCVNGERWLERDAFSRLKDKMKSQDAKPERRRYMKEWRKKKYAACEATRQKASQVSMLRYERLKQTGEIKEVRARAWSKRYYTNTLYWLQYVVRGRLSQAFKSKGLKKPTKTEVMLGCSYEELRKHIEAQFKPGMSWKNKGRGGWHVDHIIPLASATNEQEIINLSHYTNLQPLWEAENLKKGAFYVKPTNPR